MDIQDSPPQRDGALSALTCPVCAAPVETADTCCSFDCTVAAEREVKRNVSLLKGFSGRQMTAEERHRITERNGSLAGALLSWRPHPPEDGPTAS
ncbi:MAG: hypothetical protein R6V28_02855 [Nitriliruptoraceae bacterium]